MKTQRINSDPSDKGKAQEELKEVAPYLADLTLPDGAYEEDDLVPEFHKELFCVLEEKANHLSTGMFIRSIEASNLVWNHLRKFTRIQDESGKWFYWRFWAPESFKLNTELQAIYKIYQWILSENIQIIGIPPQSYIAKLLTVGSTIKDHINGELIIRNLDKLNKILFSELLVSIFIREKILEHKGIYRLKVRYIFLLVADVKASLDITNRRALSYLVAYCIKIKTRPSDLNSETKIFLQDRNQNIIDKTKYLYEHEE